jgi:ligand-binding sensor domain-containing protein/signal transduction histidine kinase
LPLQSIDSAHARHFSHLQTIFIVLGISLAFASKPYMPVIEDPLLEQWRWRNFPELNGKGVHCLTEDRHHAMWFGVDKGVIYYDGYHWQTYNRKNGFIDGRITTLYAARDGSVYAGSDSGLFVFNIDRWQPLFEQDINAQFCITSIFILADKTILCGTKKGLLLIAGDKKMFFTPEIDVDNFTGNGCTVMTVTTDATLSGQFYITDIQVDRNGKILLAVGYQEGLSGKIVQMHIPNGSYENATFNMFYMEEKDARYFNGAEILQTDDGKAWLINNQYDRGHLYFTGNKPVKFNLGHQFGEDEIANSILQTQDGTLWIGGMGKIYTLKNDNWKIYRHTDILIPASKRILLYETADGTLWIAGKQNEVYRFDYTSNSWATYRGLNFESESKDGTQWFLTVEGRAVIRKNDIWHSYGTEDGLIDAPVRIYITCNDDVWAAGSHNGVAATAYFKDGRWHKKLHPQLSWSIDYRSVFENKEGKLWFGASIDIDVKKGEKGGSLCLSNPAQKKTEFTHYLTEQKEPGAYGLGQSRDGTVWMAGVSVCYLKEGKWHNIISPKALTYHTDYMCSSADGILWVGSRNYGVFRYDGSTWENYTVEHGLQSNSVTFILPESDSCIWVATDKGISKYDGQSWSHDIFPARLNIFAEGGSIRASSGGGIWINKSSRDWNRRIHTSRKNLRSVYNNYWAVYYKKDTRPPKTSIPFYEEKVYQPGNTIISWEGLDPWSNTPVEKLQYSYRMDGGTWSPFSYKKNNIFLSLPSGDHLFEVRARDLDFNIDPQPAFISFNVAPPFYFQPAFYIPILILVFLSIILQIRIISRGRKLRLAKRDTDNILNNVEEGLALIDHTFKMGSQYSLILEQILEEKSLAKRSLLDILKDKVSQDILKTTQNYLKIMFDKVYDQQMMDDLNPLSDVKLELGPKHDPKYLAFKFRRIDISNGKPGEMIVTIRDITSEKVLGIQLKESQEKARRQMDWLVSILHIDPPLLQEFLTTAEKELKFIEKIVSEVTTVRNHKEIMTQIYRAMHLLKGNASLLSLDIFAEQAHGFEDKVSELQKKEALQLHDMNILNDELSNIKTTLTEVNNLLERIGKIHQQMRPKRSYEYAMLIKSFKDLIDKLSKKANKKIILKHDKFKIEQIPHRDHLLVKEIIVQLIRNAVVHGVEPVEERRAQNKPATATIEISTSSDKKNYTIKIGDDGRGIQTAKLRERAKASRKWSDEEIVGWHDDQLKELIFEHGISTSDEVDIAAGRGVGMDLVKEKVQSHDGRIKVETEQGKFCQFEITLPRPAPAK